jgi:hypothetical protein
MTLVSETPSPTLQLVRARRGLAARPRVTVQELLLEMLRREKFARFEDGMNVILDKFAEGDWQAIHYVTAQMNGVQAKGVPGRVIEQLPDPNEMAARVRGEKK